MSKIAICETIIPTRANDKELIKIRDIINQAIDSTEGIWNCFNDYLSGNLKKIKISTIALYVDDCLHEAINNSHEGRDIHAVISLEKYCTKQKNNICKNKLTDRKFLINIIISNKKDLSIQINFKSRTLDIKCKYEILMGVIQNLYLDFLLTDYFLKDIILHDFENRTSNFGFIESRIHFYKNLLIDKSSILFGLYRHNSGKYNDNIVFTEDYHLIDDCVNIWKQYRLYTLNKEIDRKRRSTFGKKNLSEFEMFPRIKFIKEIKNLLPQKYRGQMREIYDYSNGIDYCLFIYLIRSYDNSSDELKKRLNNIFRRKPKINSSIIIPADDKNIKEIQHIKHKILIIPFLWEN